MTGAAATVTKSLDKPAATGHDYGVALAWLVAFLTAFGMVAIYAASSLKGAQQFGSEYLFLKKQAIATSMGIIASLVIWKLPFRAIERLTLPAMLGTLFLLALVFVPGAYSKVGGAYRWLNLPLIGGQPGEMAKLAFVLFLAKNLSRPSQNIRLFRSGILPNFVILAAFTLFLLVQRDLGTPAVMVSILFVMLFVAGMAWRYIVGAFALATGAIASAIVLEPYRMARIMSFLDPWSQADGGGFQIIQSFLAFKNGGLFGVGIGESKQKLFFLPEAHTDFILSVVGEEFGLFGVLFLCLAFAYVGFLGFRIAMLQPSVYRKFLAIGLTAMITLQALVNMGVTMGVLPTKGMTLPFISSGSSSILVFLTAAALLVKIGLETPGRPEKDPDHREFTASPS